MKFSRRIYLDHAAVTPIDKRVTKEMRAFSGPEYGNPSAIHREGVRAKRALELARQRIARVLSGHADEIIFTGSGTEANNLALLGAFKKLVLPVKLGGLGKMPSDLHLVASTIEHASVLEAVKHLEEMGVAVSRVGVDADGLVDFDALEKMIRPNTFCVSVMYVNNEIGTIQPVREIARAVRHSKKINMLGGIYPYFHCDASQAPVYLPINVESFGADLITLDSHKVYGPRGIGMLWVKRGMELSTLIYGGGQEHGLRAGTENLPAAAGFARALELCESERTKESARIQKLRDYFFTKLQSIFPKIILNGSLTARIANNINVSFPAGPENSNGASGEVDHEFLLLQLDAKGIACSTKSSCLRDEDESYVIRALRQAQKTPGQNPHALRFTLGRSTTKSDIDYTIKIIQKILQQKIINEKNRPSLRVGGVVV